MRKMVEDMATSISSSLLMYYNFVYVMTVNLNTVGILDNFFSSMSQRYSRELFTLQSCGYILYVSIWKCSFA